MKELKEIQRATQLQKNSFSVKQMLHNWFCTWKFSVIVLLNHSFFVVVTLILHEMQFLRMHYSKHFGRFSNFFDYFSLFRKKVELVNDNLFEWYVRVYDIDPESELAYDMQEQNVSCILLHIIFPDNFPFLPPFMRVVEPKIEKGFVMKGGAICMELLTPRGWASAYTVEAIIMQFAASLSKGRARIARTKKPNKDFSKQSAEEAFRSLVKTHDKYGWVTPALADG